MSYSATLFMNVEKYYRREPCFDARFDNQVLPRGSAGVGFFRTEGVGAPNEGIVDNYYTNDLSKIQKENLQKTISFIFAVLDGEDIEVIMDLNKGLL